MPQSIRCLPLIAVGVAMAPAAFAQTAGPDASGYASEPGFYDFVDISTTGTDLVAGDDNNTYDAFLYDRQTGTTSVLSRAIDGGTGQFTTSVRALTPDGSHALLWGDAPDLVPGDTNFRQDVFLRHFDAWLPSAAAQARLELWRTDRETLQSDGEAPTR